MYLTGIADEASQNIKEQISATKELGWNAIESRFINGKNIHDISEEEFERVLNALDGSGVYINAFGSAIGNWGRMSGMTLRLLKLKLAVLLPE